MNAGKTYWLVALISLALVGVFFSLGRFHSSTGETGYMPGRGYDAGDELVLLYLTAHSCTACQDPELPALVERLKLGLQATANEREWSFHAIGVDLDWDVDEGTRHVASHGRFDEVAAGGGWLNNAGVRYLWGNLGGQPEVPQVVLLHRELNTPPEGMFGVKSEVVLKRQVGKAAIRRWLNLDLPVPYPDSDVSRSASRQGGL